MAVVGQPSSGASNAAPATTSAGARVAQAAESGDGSDRIERSEELARCVLEQKDSLARLASPPQEQIDEYRAGLADAASVSRSSLETAASGLLRGELFFHAAGA